MSLLNRLGYAAVFAGCLASLGGCSNGKPIGKQDSYPSSQKVESRVSESEATKKGLESKVEKTNEEQLPQVSYEKVIEFFEPMMLSAGNSEEEREKFKQFIKEDEDNRNLLYAIYSNPRGFERNRYSQINHDELLEFQENLFSYVKGRQLSEVQKYIPFAPKDLSQLKSLQDTNLSDKQYGDLLLLYIDEQIRSANVMNQNYH